MLTFLKQVLPGLPAPTAVVAASGKSNDDVAPTKKTGAIGLVHGAAHTMLSQPT